MWVRPVNFPFNMEDNVINILQINKTIVMGKNKTNISLLEIILYNTIAQ